MAPMNHGRGETVDPVVRLTHQQDLARRSRPGLVCLVVGVVWIALLGGDWWLRFRTFRWQDTIILQNTSRGTYEPMQVVTNPPVQGGDLTVLLGADADAARFKEWKPAATNWYDEFGFRNRPPTVGRYYPIVVVGDSFMYTGPTMDDTFPGRLALVSGKPVYSYAREGRGLFWAIERVLLLSDLFRDREPEVVVWGILEREIHAPNFEEALAKLEHWDRRERLGLSRGWVDSSELSAARLRTTLPDSSALAMIAGQSWSRLRYAVLGRLNTSVVEAEGLVGGKRLLFFSPSIEGMKVPPSARNLPVITKTIKAFDDLCRARGLRLYVVLIPDKEQVYRSRIPPALHPPEHPLAPSVLDELEVALRQAGVPAINLLGPFRDEAARDRLLYWSDDTHWKPEAVDLAVRRAWPEIHSLMHDR
jgi:hypothetical protein